MGSGPRFPLPKDSGLVALEKSRDWRTCLIEGDWYSAVETSSSLCCHQWSPVDNNSDILGLRMGSLVASGAFFLLSPVPQRSAFTWEVSDIDVEAGLWKGCQKEGGGSGPRFALPKDSGLLLRSLGIDELV